MTKLYRFEQLQLEQIRIIESRLPEQVKTILKMGEGGIYSIEINEDYVLVLKDTVEDKVVFKCEECLFTENYFLKMGVKSAGVVSE
jgi:hypothetical protein